MRLRKGPFYWLNLVRGNRRRPVGTYQPRVRRRGGTLGPLRGFDGGADCWRVQATRQECFSQLVERASCPCGVATCQLRGCGLLAREAKQSARQLTRTNSMPALTPVCRTSAGLRRLPRSNSPPNPIEPGRASKHFGRVDAYQLASATHLSEARRPWGGHGILRPDVSRETMA